MNQDSLTRNAITKLIQDTQDGKVVWSPRVIKEIKLPHEGEIVDKAYYAVYNKKPIRIFRYRYKDISFEVDVMYWNSGVKLQVLDMDGYVEWEFPEDNSLTDLYESVRFKVANISDFIGDIMGLEISKAFYGTKKNVINIADQLTDKIVDNELHVVINNKIAGDPDPGKRKTLNIVYKYRGSTYVKEIAEDEKLDIP